MKLWKAIGCNGNGEWGEFTKILKEDDDNCLLDFQHEVENRGFNVVTIYRPKDVKVKERL